MTSQSQGRLRAAHGLADLLAAEAALAGLEGDPDQPRFLERLRQRATADVSRLAADVARARGRAVGRHPLGALGFFTSRGLEQATTTAVARARAERVAACAPERTVLDATCGVGGDSLALALAGLRVVSADRDPLLAACARLNLERAGVPARVTLGDALAPVARTDLLVLDPDRRAGGERSLDPGSWSPTLHEALALAGRFRGACLKLAPGLDPLALERRGATGLLQWVSLDGELRELALWTGLLTGGHPPGTREALALTSSGASTRLTGRPRRVPPLSPEEARGVAWLADPDPAVVRAGLLGQLAAEQGLAPLASQLAYLGGDRRPRSALLRAFRVVESCPCDARVVRRMLTRHGVGSVEVRKRGHPATAEALARRFRGGGRRHGRLAVARLERGHVAYLIVPAEEAPGPTGPSSGVGDEGIEPPASSL